MRGGPAAVLVVLAAVACGSHVDPRLAAEAIEGGLPVADAFAGELEQGRFDEALAYATGRFRASVPPASLRDVQSAVRDVLGGRRSRGDATVEDATAPQAGGPAADATLAFDVEHERGEARVRVRVVREPPAGPWRLDGYEVRGELFTWTFAGMPPEGGR